MKHTPWNEGWQFLYTPFDDFIYRKKDGEGFCEVTLPHDFKIELTRTPDLPAGASEGHYPGGMGHYRKTLTADEALLAGRVLLLFDGAYRFAHVRVNRDLETIHPGGYSPFLADLTGRLAPGDNIIEVTLDATLMPASRWYTGAGLYRGVTLLTGGDAVIAPWGVCVKTPVADRNASTVEITTELEGEGLSGCTLRTTVLGSSGNALAMDEQPAFTMVRQALTLTECSLWSPDAPALYTARTELLRDGAAVDTADTVFGIRTISVDARRGLRLNGAPLKLKGGCVHHDCGVLGAAAHLDAERRKVRLLKESGFNAVRCAHNPPSTAFLDACDRLGLLVVDEAFDCWREGKKPQDEHIFFEREWEAELTAMVLRDRNHPSVIIWSTGNEIVERSGVSDGALWARRLADKVRALDDTRPVNNALCGFFEDPAIAEMAANSRSTAGEGKDYWAQHSEDFAAPLDIVGYNYLLDRYEMDHALYPDRVMMGTESFPVQALENWQAVLRHPFLLGDFVWTAWDYIGESGIGHSKFNGPAHGLLPFPWHLAYCGDIDICGNKRPQSHYRDFVWSGRETPHIVTQPPEYFGKEEHLSAWGWQEVQESWNYKGWEGKPVLVTVYAAGDEVSLSLNGQAIASRPCGEANGYKAAFEVPYRPGALEAVAFRGGAEIGRAQLATAGPASGVRMALEAESAEVAPGSLLYVPLEVVDAAGRRVPDAEHELLMTLTGPAKVLAMGCANPAGDQQYTVPESRAFQGRALAVLRVTGRGRVHCTALGGELRSASMEFTV